jgi:hypothetical protein
VDGLDDQVCQRGPAKVGRTDADLVEQPVHGRECLSGAERAGREGSIHR